MDSPIVILFLAGLVFASMACPLFVLWDEWRRPYGTRTVTRRFP